MMLVLVLICIVGHVASQLTVAQVNVMKTRLNRAIDESYDELENTHPLIAGAVRLAFHDCVGGCDGCINHNNPENAGLRFYTNQLDSVYDAEFSSQLSRADFYVLASITAVERGAEFANCLPEDADCTPQLTFRYGRPDCPTSPNTNIVQEFPNAREGVGDQITYFQNEFGFNVRETVAIIGAHTLGRAHTENLGWEGSWVRSADVLNNAFYHDMQDAGWRWTHRDNTPYLDERHFQWEGSGGVTIMLNSDMGLLLDQEPNEDGSVDCDWSNFGGHKTQTCEMVLSLVLICTCIVGHVTSQLTVAQVNATKARINEAITESYDELLFTHPLLAGSVRLAFHDCVGGCDGCINHNNPENAGLRFYTNTLDPIYDAEFSDQFSRADFYVLAAITAVERGAEFANCLPEDADCTPQLTFRYGRPDCPTSPNTDLVLPFPDAHRGVENQTAYFQREFGFNVRETVAIIGAHTLGRAHTENSGWEGRWVQNPDALNNAFYTDMQDAGWRWIHWDNTEYLNVSHFQWEGSRGGEAMMLNSDMGLLLDQEPNEDGSVDCDWSVCPFASTVDILNEYAFLNNVWIRDFTGAFQKLIENKNSNLALPTP
ncbi:unnamed protein product [Owenia fusiformis]|uniref:Plant heme peroxidase family profile domain-containing protein n=1 Tax=Owenia fusiformis TaxID=6347 RepID=A0A8S4NGP0_OWEFU|nr:unnamed protein product [Owenia fusiformis]